MDLKETDALGDDVGQHWYYRSKACAVKRLMTDLPASAILDVGAGSAFFTKELLSNTSAREAWCVDTSYDREFESSENGKPIHFKKSIDSVDANLVLMMDVLEHVDDDVGLLKIYSQKVLPGTHFLISVPAFNILWSDHDVYLEHRRRYTLKQIEAVVRQAGLSVEHGCYYFGAVFPIAAAIRVGGKILGASENAPRSQLRRHHPLINSALATISKAEQHIMQKNRLFGLTAFCVAKTR